MERLLIPIKTTDEKQKCLQITPKSSLFKKRLVKTWTVEEDQKLLKLYHQYPKKWSTISEMMGNRNQNQCLHRFRRICQLGNNKKIWSPQEDQTVLKMIDKVGYNWKVIAQALGTKTGKQIRERFINKLDPSIRREEWTEQEDLKIIQLFTKWGSKWCDISKCLQGRPENRIKNRFYSYIQKNYEFKVQDKGRQDQNDLQNKQNAPSPLTAGIRLIQKKESQCFSLQKKSSSIRILQEKINRQIYESEVSDSSQSEQQVDNKIKDEYESEMAEEEKQGQNSNSLRQINQENYFKCEDGNNSDLLYFQDNE